MQEFVSERRAAIVGSAEPAALLALIPPDREGTELGMPWQEGTEEDPAWYVTD